MEHPPPGKPADHIYLAMGKVEHAQDAIDHSIADGNQCIDTPQGQAVDELLG